MLLVCFFLLAGSTFAQRCNPGWSYYNNRCYKHIYDTKNRVNYLQALRQCRQRGSELTDVGNEEEMKFVAALASRPGGWDSAVDSMTSYSVNPDLLNSYQNNPNLPDYPNFLLVGATKNAQKLWYWPNSKSAWVNWCYFPGYTQEPTNGPNEDCTIMQIDRPCVYDAPCSGSWGKAYPYEGYSHFVCKKGANPAPPTPLPPKPTIASVCTNTGSVAQADGTCTCKTGYFDIKDANVPEGKYLKKGEVCIPNTPCQNLTATDSLAIVFVVDSSQSIGAQNWKDMVKFLQSGAKQLDNSIKIGFVKFSSNVTYSNWLPKKWTQDDYLEGVPTRFDAEYTNTPAALDAAVGLFSSDDSTNQVAILITDGMPYVKDVLSKTDAMPQTEAAAERLYNAKIQLVALGYGEELQKYQKFLKKVLKNPQKDYFEFDKEASGLKAIHMTILLNKAQHLDCDVNPDGLLLIDIDIWRHNEIGYSHYMCKKLPSYTPPPPLPVCNGANSELKSDGKCGCKQGFFNIKEPIPLREEI